MTALFLLFADAALASANPPGQAGDIIVTAPAGQRGTPWSPNVDDWSDDTPTCPYVFDEEIAGFGKLHIGPRCGDREDGLAHGEQEWNRDETKLGG